MPIAGKIDEPAEGETNPAIAEPVFMMPLAVPENFGATSIGTDQIGPIVTSRQKKAPLKQIAITTRSWNSSTGTRKTKDPNRLRQMTLRRATRKFPVRRRSQSLSTPPTVSPTTPANSTPKAKNAVFLRLRP